MRIPVFLISVLTVLMPLVAVLNSTRAASAAQLEAGVAKIEITDRAAGAVHDPSFVKVLILKSGETVAALITVDAVAIGEIGRIGKD